MSSLIGIFLLLVLAEASYAFSCSYCYHKISQCSGNNITCPSGQECGSSYKETRAGGDNSAYLVRLGESSSECIPLNNTSVQQEKVRMISSCCDTDDCDLYGPACAKMAGALSWTFVCATKCNFMGSMSLQHVQIKMGTSCFVSKNCTLSSTLPTQSYTLNGLVCPSCVSADSAWCYTDDTIQCTGDETMCIFLQETGLMVWSIAGSMSTSTAFRGCATKSFCDLGSQLQNETGSVPQVKINCTRASTSGSTTGSTSSSTISSTSPTTNSSISVHKVVLSPAILCLLLLKLI